MHYLAPKIFLSVFMKNSQNVYISVLEISRQIDYSDLFRRVELKKKAGEASCEDKETLLLVLLYHCCQPGLEVV